MQLGEIIGRVSSTQKMETLRGLTLVIVHQLSPEGTRHDPPQRARAAERRGGTAGDIHDRRRCHEGFGVL